jgi:hypothetical protein
MAKELSKKLSWATILDNPDDIKIETMWRLYANNVFKGLEVSAVQYQEMKQTYYCAFTECFKIMNDVSLAFSEEQAGRILTRISNEGNDYIDALIERTLK